MNAEPYAYIRRSVARKDDPGDVSRDSQTNKVRDLANGDGARLRILDGDWGITAAREETHRRLAFLDLMESVERGEVSTIYAFALDRLARSVQWSARLLDACEDSGTIIITGEGRFDPGNDRDRQMFHFYAMQNEGVLRGMKQKAKAAVGTRTRRGDKLGQRPYGEVRRLKDGRVVGDDEDVDLVLRTFREAGSYFAAARLLNERGVPARSGGPWYPRTVQRVVNAHAPSTVPLGQRKGARALGTRLLSGLLVCHCGTLMGQTTSRWAIKYRCPKGATNKDHGRYYVSEDAILPAIKDEAAHLRPSSWRIAGRTDDGQLGALTAERTSVIDYGVKGRIDDDEVERRLAEIDAKLDELRQRAAVDAAAAVIPDAIDWSATPAIVNAALRALWSEVRLGDDLMPVKYGWRRKEWRAD